MNLDLIRRKQKWVLAIGALSFSSYGAYTIYNLPSVAKKRERWSKLLGALFCVTEMLSDSAEAIGIVSKDFKEFLQSDSDQIPNSFKQISKITRSDEFLDSLTNITRAMTVGILRGCSCSQEIVKTDNSDSKKSDFSDQLLDKLFSDAGSGFVSVIVGSFAKNLVMAYYSEKKMNVNVNALEKNNSLSWIDVIHDDKCRELVGDCVQKFVSTAVTVFLDKTMHINTYEELFSGMTNPKHEAQVTEILTSLCNGVVETLVKTSHQVLTSKERERERDTYTHTSDSAYLSSRTGQIPRRDSPALVVGRQLVSSESKARRLCYENQESGLIRKMSSTLAMANNRRFVLDVTGKVTFETVRSILEFIVARLSDSLKKSMDAIHEEVVDMGLEVAEELNRKSSAIFTVCITLCLHILNGPWVLVPN